MELDPCVTELYVIIDDWVRTQPPEPVTPGRPVRMHASELLTLAVPQDFLDEAAYPIVVDPTVGYTWAVVNPRLSRTDSDRRGTLCPPSSSRFRDS